MTDQGQRFYTIADKWRELWKETNEIFADVPKPELSIAATESVSLYLLPKVLDTFLRCNCSLRFFNYYSPDAYRYVESGRLDLAFIEEPRYFKDISAVPAFSEPFVAVGSNKLSEKDRISIEQLSPENEIHIHWNYDFENWRSKYFDDRIPPLISLNQISLIPYFLTEKAWSIVPYSTGKNLEQPGIKIYHIADGPPDRFIYYLIRNCEKDDRIQAFLSLVHQELGLYPELVSYLQ